MSVYVTYSQCQLTYDDYSIRGPGENSFENFKHLSKKLTQSLK